jgi:hypothetical protein
MPHFLPNHKKESFMAVKATGSATGSNQTSILPSKIESFHTENAVVQKQTETAAQSMLANMQNRAVPGLPPEAPSASCMTCMTESAKSGLACAEPTLMEEQWSCRVALGAEGFWRISKRSIPNLKLRFQACVKALQAVEERLGGIEKVTVTQKSMLVSAFLQALHGIDVFNITNTVMVNEANAILKRYDVELIAFQSPTDFVSPQLIEMVINWLEVGAPFEPGGYAATCEDLNQLDDTEKVQLAKALRSALPA